MTETHCDIESFCKFYPSYDDVQGNPCSMKHSCIYSTKSSDAVLNERLINIFEDVIKNRRFELGYDEIQDVMKKLRSQHKERER